MKRTKVMKTRVVIEIGELREQALFSEDFYDRLLKFITAHPHSLARLFEIGAVSAMAAFSGDTFELSQYNPAVTLPARQASPRARRKSPARRAKAKKRP
jgi:hypothetical protein